jgi:hypothetical protein
MSNVNLKTKNGEGKRSFISKNLRPEVVGQYYNTFGQKDKTEIESNSNWEVFSPPQPLKKVVNNDIKTILNQLNFNKISNCQCRRESILKLIAGHVENNCILKDYQETLRDMFPHVTQQILQKDGC